MSGWDSNTNNDTWGVKTTSTNDTWNEGGVTTATNDQWNGDGATNATNGFEDNAATNGFGGEEQAAQTFGGPGGGCFNCGEEGHMKAECPNPAKPREFTGTCNGCGETGHQARSCPNKPKFCKQCHAENDHDTMECKNKKVIDRSRIEDKSVDEAWAMLKQASDEVDIGDFREAVDVLAKALDGSLSYLDLEKESRKRNFSIHLIALKKDVPVAYTNVDIEGNVGKTYTLAYFTSASCPRPILMPLWPKDVAENLDRLEDVGVPMESGVTICGNCDQPGHVRKDCPEEKREFEGAKVMCALCDKEGHRVRDCTEERKKERAPRTCKVCGSEEHIAKDCDNRPPDICNNCFQEGHRKADCLNERVFKCNNCEELGHVARECKDWSKHKCRYCGEFGHGSENRCDPEKKAAFVAAKAAAEAEKGGEGAGDSFEAGGSGFDTGANDNGGSAGNDAWANTAALGASGGWENTVAPAAAATSGGW